MTLHEFDIIQAFFNNQLTQRSDVILGIGDDAAIVTVATDQDLVITTDTLVSGIHFPENTSAYDIGYKALAVNLSDLAAMGATPCWVTLALTLPTADVFWLKQFTDGFFALANRFNVQLIGGDLTKGPLTITVQAHGLTPKNSAIRRSGARPGDLIYVTNTVGDAGLALKLLQDKNAPEQILKKLCRPEPQITIGEKLRGIASAAIDISDGLAADLGHILEKSETGASVYVDELPLSNEILNLISHDDAIQLALNAGDDYELCFTVPENKSTLLKTALYGYAYTCIGKITETKTLDLKFKNGTLYVFKNQGYQHF